MSITLEVVTEADRPVVVKRADAADADLLRREGLRLAAASHPGVVQLISSGPVGDGWEVRTIHGGRPLDVAGPLSVAQVAGLAAAVAATLADLHTAGVVHGRLDASHVLLGAYGRPVLCGFGPGGEPAGQPSDDVAGLGAILGDLLGLEGEGEPIPEHRWSRGRGWTGWERRALLTLADQACAIPATRRPTARRFASAISEAVPAAALDSAGTPTGHLAVDDTTTPPATAERDPLDALRASASSPPVRPVRLPSLMLAAAGLAALTIGLSRSGHGSPTARHEATAPTRAVEPADPTTIVPPTTSTTTAPAACGPVGGVDLDGDGCREAVTVAGVVVTVGDRRFRVGDEGDRVAIRDWDCDGVATPAVLRPSTGEVYLFADWDLDEPVVVGPVATVVGAAELVVDPMSEECSGLSVRTTSDELVEVVRGPA